MWYIIFYLDWDVDLSWLIDVFFNLDWVWLFDFSVNVIRLFNDDFFRNFDINLYFGFIVLWYWDILVDNTVLDNTLF